MIDGVVEPNDVRGGANEPGIVDAAHDAPAQLTILADEILQSNTQLETMTGMRSGGLLIDRDRSVLRIAVEPGDQTIDELGHVITQILTGERRGLRHATANLGFPFFEDPVAAVAQDLREAHGTPAVNGHAEMDVNEAGDPTAAGREPAVRAGEAHPPVRLHEVLPPVGAPIEPRRILPMTFRGGAPRA
jgi:hypothetical protein